MTDLFSISHLIHRFCTYTAQKIQYVCTCFCTTHCDTLSMEKTDVLCHLVQNICFCALKTSPTAQWKRRNAAMEKMTDYIVMLLETYAKTTNKIKLLYYELQHCGAITPEETIEMMSLAHRENYVNTNLPHDVAGIAACFREITEKMNQETIAELSVQLTTLVDERNRLLYYVNLLEPRKSTVLTEHYFSQRSWTEVAVQLGLTRRTVYKIRKDAIDDLAKFYSYKENIFPQKTIP